MNLATRIAAPPLARGGASLVNIYKQPHGLANDCMYIHVNC